MSHLLFLRKKCCSYIVNAGKILCQGVYLTQNTSQAASVEFVRHERTNYARSRLQRFVVKAQRGFTTV
jgi:hypothetical protein